MAEPKRLLALVSQLLGSTGSCARCGCRSATLVRFDPPPDASWERQQFCFDHATERIYELSEPDLNG